jgi:hypothetical protein
MNAPPIKVPIVAVDKLTTGVQQMAAKMARITAPLVAIQTKMARLSAASGLDRIGAAAGRVGSSFRNMASTITGLITKIGFFGAAAGGGLFALVKTTADFGDEIATVAGNLGITAQALQELRYAAVKSDVEVETLDQSLMFLSKNAAGAAAGEKKFAALFAALGVPLRDASGAMRGTEEVFLDTVSAMGKIRDPMMKTRLALELFGRAGSKMVSMVNGGSEALKAYREEARRLGVMTAEDIAAAEEFDNTYKGLQFTLLSLRNTVGTKLIPVFTEMSAKLTKYLVAHRPQIEAFARAFAEKLPGALVAIRDGLVDVWGRLKPFAEYLAGIVDTIGPANAILGGLAAVIGVQLVTAIGSFIAAITSLNALLVATPAGWLIMAGAGFLGAVGASGFALHKYFKDLDQRARMNSTLGFNPTVTETGQADTAKMGRLLELYRKQAAFPDTFTQEDESEQVSLESALHALGLSGDFGSRFVALNDMYNQRVGAGSVSTPGAGQPVKQESKVVVEFKNAPENLNIGDIKGPVPIDVRMGFNLIR